MAYWFSIYILTLYVQARKDEAEASPKHRHLAQTSPQLVHRPCQGATGLSYCQLLRKWQTRVAIQCRGRHFPMQSADFNMLFSYIIDPIRFVSIIERTPALLRLRALQRRASIKEAVHQDMAVRNEKPAQCLGTLAHWTNRLQNGQQGLRYSFTHLLGSQWQAFARCLQKNWVEPDGIAFDEHQRRRKESPKRSEVPKDVTYISHIWSKFRWLFEQARFIYELLSLKNTVLSFRFLKLKCSLCWTNQLNIMTQYFVK